MKGHRWFATVYDLLMRGLERDVLSQIRPWIAGDATGRVLEIGAGTGANLPYYRNSQSIIALEPDPFMIDQARKQAANLGLDIDFRLCPAEALPFPDASFDTVVATLVFCTVSDPARSLAEVRRVLRPNGTLRFIEHVRAPEGFMATVQDVITPVWRRLAAGCHPNRPTLQSIEEAGFEIVQLDERLIAFSPFVFGVARKMEIASNA